MIGALVHRKLKKDSCQLGRRRCPGDGRCDPVIAFLQRQIAET